MPIGLYLTVRYLPGEALGDPFDKAYSVPPPRRATIDVNTVAGAGRDISLKVEGDIPFAVERPVYFASSMEGTAPPAASRGCIDDGYQCWLCILNPGSQYAAVTATCYLRGDTPAPEKQQYKVQTGSRYTKTPNEAVGENRTFLFKIAWSVPLLSEVATCFAASSLTTAWVSWPDGAFGAENRHTIVTAKLAGYEGYRGCKRI